MIGFVAAIVSIMTVPGATDGVPEIQLCDVIGVPPRLRETRIVSITARVGMERHHGLYLHALTDCPTDPSNTDMLLIELPRGRPLSDFPELERLDIGRMILCTLIGRVSYPDGFARFDLIGVVSCERQGLRERR